MLSARENAIKEALMEEMNGLSYADHRNIKDAINAEFIAQESIKVKKVQRRLTILVFLALVLILIHVGLTMQESPILKLLIPISIAISFTIATAGNLSTLIKRKLALRIFMILAEEEQIGATV